RTLLLTLLPSPPLFRSSPSFPLRSAGPWPSLAFAGGGGDTGGSSGSAWGAGAVRGGREAGSSCLRGAGPGRSKSRALAGRSAIEIGRATSELQSPDHLV